MDSVTQLIEEARAVGLAFTAPGGGRLTITGKPTAAALAIIERAKQLKPQILEVLTANSEAPSGWDVIDAELTINPAVSDLVLFAGAIVTPEELGVLQCRATAAGFTMHAKQSGALWYVVGFDAGREMGAIKCGYPTDEGNYHYKITYTSPLYNPTAAAYRAWLWGQMQSNATVLYELYTIANAAYMGCDVYIDGPNDDGVQSAVAYILRTEAGPYLLRGDK